MIICDYSQIPCKLSEVKRITQWGETLLETVSHIPKILQVHTLKCLSFKMFRLQAAHSVKTKRRRKRREKIYQLNIQRIYPTFVEDVAEVESTESTLLSELLKRTDTRKHVRAKFSRTCAKFKLLNVELAKQALFHIFGTI